MKKSLGVLGTVTVPLRLLMGRGKQKMLRDGGGKPTSYGFTMLAPLSHGS